MTKKQIFLSLFNFNFNSCLYSKNARTKLLLCLSSDDFFLAKRTIKYPFSIWYRPRTQAIRSNTLSRLIWSVAHFADLDDDNNDNDNDDDNGGGNGAYRYLFIAIRNLLSLPPYMLTRMKEASSVYGHENIGASGVFNALFACVKWYIETGRSRRIKRTRTPNAFSDI